VREMVAAAEPPPHLFVLDAGGVEDLDFTGGRALLQVVHELHQRGVDFAVARSTGETPRDAAKAGLRKHIGDDHMFLTVDEAVRTLASPETPPDHGSGGGMDPAAPPSLAPRSTTPGGQP
jgi:SulP family sulfate permease